ncbi:MAG: hypothetical protein ACQSGP_05505, partial [Frankia sp.]
SLTRVYRIGDDTVRVRIFRDHYPDQSYALADVLRPNREWTNLATNPPSGWHHTTRPAHPNDTTAFSGLADRLAARAATILAAAPPPATHPHTTPRPTTGGGG